MVAASRLGCAAHSKPRAEPLLAAGYLLGEIGAAMTGVREMGVPTRGRTKHEFDLARVAGGHGATDHLATDRDWLAAHGTHERGTASHEPLFTTESRGLDLGAATWGRLDGGSAKTCAHLVDRGEHVGLAQNAKFQRALAGKVHQA